MKSQNMFSAKIERNISICRLLKILPRVLNVKAGRIGPRSLSYQVSFLY